MTQERDGAPGPAVPDAPVTVEWAAKRRNSRIQRWHSSMGAFWWQMTTGALLLPFGIVAVVIGVHERHWGLVVEGLCFVPTSLFTVGPRIPAWRAARRRGEPEVMRLAAPYAFRLEASTLVLPGYQGIPTARWPLAETRWVVTTGPWAAVALTHQPVEGPGGPTRKFVVSELDRSAAELREVLSRAGEAGSPSPRR